ncbi:hypothetical protein FHS95_003982 [Sphingomonas naasensis]|uniref:META domain-containing protein n=1 Tax=Sphingomonas naasensis TaxID=1344951 RepID=A0A4S1WCP3_9SPHN|nr:hypothetical protein [Sphingomonas naasensis]NIJ22267.1 hypothetical protein [Sphingomonas naasensis]TGX40721.1 hypothetical protein E5A74_14615 [Sphingomonas naasensis]
MRKMVTGLAILAAVGAGAALARAGQSATQASMDARLSGDWRWGSASTVDQYNPATNRFVTPNGSGGALRFTSNGGFVQTGYLQTGSMCTNRIMFWKKGRVQVANGKIRFLPTASVRRIEDSCNSSAVKETRNWATAEDFAFAVSGSTLKLTSDGVTREYDRR